MKDEQETIATLAAGIEANVPSNCRHEIVFIDDGSTDDSWQVIRRLSIGQPHLIRGIKFRHNAGKATALAAGFQEARGDIVLTMDADLQDDPQEIPRFLEKLEEGYDLVSGWKKIRHDPWHKVWPSRVFNLFASVVGGVRLHDHNCGFKCYRRAVTDRILLFGELHRVTPSLANMYGFRCAEIQVKHHVRRAGCSKYGLERIIRGLCDVTTTGFLRRFRQRPAHFFNVVAGLQIVLASAAAAAGTYGVAQGEPAGTAFYAAATLTALAASSFLAGLLAELIIRGPLHVSRELPIVAQTESPVATSLRSGKGVKTTRGKRPESEKTKCSRLAATS